MRYLLAVAHLHGGRVALTCGTVLALAVAPAGAATPLTALVTDGPGQWPVVLLFAGLGIIAAFTLLYFSADYFNRRRRRALREQLDRLDFPAAVSGVDGQLRWVNRAMWKAYGDRHGDILGMLGNCIEVDAGQIYRLANSAREMGFALAPVRLLSSDERVVLAARFEMPNDLIWTVLPADRLPEIAREGKTDSYETATLESVPVALVQFDFEGRLLWGNSLAREMLDRELIPGTALTDLVETLGRPLDSLIADAVADARGRREMVRLRGAAAETFLQISLTSVTLGAARCLLAVLSDASELRLLEDKFAQSQKMEAVGKLAGGVAHDFNNVLTAISGHSDLLLLGKDVLHPDYSDLMQIHQNTYRAAALVRQLLAFSRKQTLNPTLLSVPDVVADSQYLLNRLIGEKVTLMLEHGRDLWAVRADHQQLEQALMNLVVNARDAMPNGGTVTIATRNVVYDQPEALLKTDIPAGDYVEISVSDDGSGIDPHSIDRVFDPFFTTKPVGEGTGLGLATVYGIVKQSGGFILAENRQQGGARFRIILPRAFPDADQKADTPVKPRIDRGDLTGTGAILLVEDEGTVRSFASRALRLRGYDVLEAASAEEAMTLLSDAENHVDLLVSDVVMPGMDGPTFAARACELRPDMRVVFISGYAEDSFRRNLISHDFLFLPKPFSLTDLTAIVKEALGQDA